MNYPALPVAAAVEVVRSWLVEAEEFVGFTEPARLSRLDVVRDFDLGSGGLGPGEVISGMGAVPVTLRAVKAHYRDPTEHQAQTLMVRTKRNGAGRLYDKGRESGLVEASGVLRFEAQERARSLSAAGFRRLDDLDGDPVVLDLGRSRFGWCGFDREFHPSAAILSRVWADPDLTEGQRLQLTGFYALRSAGIGVPIERRRLYRLRHLAERFGYPAETAYRLDFDSARLVAA